MRRKVTVEVKHRLQIFVDEGVEVKHVMDEMECTFSSTIHEAAVVDDEMIDYEVTDSR